LILAVLHQPLFQRGKTEVSFVLIIPLYKAYIVYRVQKCAIDIRSSELSILYPLCALDRQRITRQWLQLAIELVDMSGKRINLISDPASGNNLYVVLLQHQCVQTIM